MPRTTSTSTAREFTVFSSSASPVARTVRKVLAERHDGRRTTHAVQRDVATTALETVALVLDDDSPLPDTDQDVHDLMARLRGHVAELGAAVVGGGPVLVRAQLLSTAPPPAGFVPSRVHLRRLAEAVRELAEVARRTEAVTPVEHRPWRLSRDVVRGVVFVLALTVLIIAASVPRT
ncbi:DUF6415 family natural product biosynthesis protein [Streptomyces fragilis]|uniref:DUF6415 family natural product biosynthesis protein n=1 Tax=Streptomyces fragilis TaxID=67301 RepID=A0ABV2YC54_9ACTN|nr:DUF6415 family natural product biosynthesis protein [Streptomyces fragilis]